MEPKKVLNIRNKRVWDIFYIPYKDGRGTVFAP